MTAVVFVDTNVLVYAVDASEPVKQTRAMEWMAHLWETRRGRVSIQVLTEFYATVTRKLKPGLGREEARREVRYLMPWNPRPVTSEVLESAWVIQDRHGLSLWDALILASAAESGCRHVLSEALGDGQRFGHLTVVNPFLHKP